MKATLEREGGVKVNHKRVRRLMKLVGLRGIAPTPKTTKAMATDYRNLLRVLNVTRPNQVWCADITYIRVQGGFAYGVSVMNLYSRKVLAFEVSNTMDEWVCIEAARKAMMRYGKPEIMHTQIAADSLWEEDSLRCTPQVWEELQVKVYIFKEI